MDVQTISTKWEIKDHLMQVVLFWEHETKNQGEQMIHPEVNSKLDQDQDSG